MREKYLGINYREKLRKTKMEIGGEGVEMREEGR
jgi:hypothetical protein